MVVWVCVGVGEAVGEVVVAVAGALCLEAAHAATPMIIIRIMIIAAHPEAESPLEERLTI